MLRRLSGRPSGSGQPRLLCNTCLTFPPQRLCYGRCGLTLLLLSPMRLTVVLAAFLLFAPLDSALAQLADTGNFHIVWEVKNRFRLFRNEADFLRQEAASRGDGVLAAEDRLERDSAGLGWA